MWTTGQKNHILSVQNPSICSANAVCFLLQILLLAQHVSGTTMPIISSSRVLYSGCCLWYFVLWFSSLLVWCGAEGYVSGLQDAGLLE